MPGDVGFQSCHASTITEINEGSACWPGLEVPQKKILMSESGSVIIQAENGENLLKWQMAFSDDNRRYPCWNPVLYNTGKEYPVIL